MIRFSFFLEFFLVIWVFLVIFVIFPEFRYFFVILVNFVIFLTFSSKFRDKTLKTLDIFVFLDVFLSQTSKFQDKKIMKFWHSCSFWVTLNSSSSKFTTVREYEVLMSSYVSKCLQSFQGCFIKVCECSQKSGWSLQGFKDVL